MRPSPRAIEAVRSGRSPASSRPAKPLSKAALSLSEPVICVPAAASSRGWSGTGESAGVSISAAGRPEASEVPAASSGFRSISPST